MGLNGTKAGLLLVLPVCSLAFLAVLRAGHARNARVSAGDVPARAADAPEGHVSRPGAPEDDEAPCGYLEFVCA